MSIREIKNCVDPPIELLIAEIELHVTWCRTQSIRVGLVNMTEEEALSCDGKWQEQWLQVAHYLISSQTRVLGGEVPRMGEFLEVLRRNRCAINIATWQLYRGDDFLVSTSCMYVLGPLKTLNLAYSNPEQWPQAPSGKSIMSFKDCLLYTSPSPRDS